MGYSYFPTQRAAAKWASENLNPIGTIVIDQLARHHQTDYRKWFVYYPIRAIWEN